MIFRVGMKVVCVAQAFGAYPGEVMPKKGCVYTVRALHSDHEGGAIWLREIKNPVVNTKDYGRRERPFDVEGFRPVVERKTDISVFKKLLVPGSKIPEHA